MAFGISRATNPQEFFDVTSSLLLIKPEPQYLHARLILSALAMKLGDGGMDMGLPIDGRDIELERGERLLRGASAQTSGRAHLDAARGGEAVHRRFAQGDLLRASRLGSTCSYTT